MDEGPLYWAQRDNALRDAVVATLAERGPLTVLQVAEAHGMTGAAARSLLQRLRDEGRVVSAPVDRKRRLASQWDVA